MAEHGRRKRLLAAIALVLLLAALAPALASACPLCKENAEGAAAAGGGVWRGMYWSILLMIAAPFSMAGTMILVILRARRRRSSALPFAEASAEAPLPFPDSRGARS